jgi:hypothetical protein
VTQEIEEEYATLEEGEDDPIEPGEIKVIKGTILELDDCDSITQWSVHSGAGVTIELDESQVYEGTGSIKVTVPVGITAIIKCTKSSGSWDLTTYKYLKVVLRAENATPNCNLYFGEAAYNEQNLGAFTMSPSWVQKSWDISGISAASRNAATIFAVYIPNASGVVRTFHIDYVFADPGPSQVKAFDGDKVIQLYPKICTGHYHGTGSPLTVTLNRKGTPSGILLLPNTGARDSFAWQTEMGGYAKNLSNSAIANTVITAVGDGYFTLGTNANTNTSTEIVSYIVMWDD